MPLMLHSLVMSSCLSWSFVVRLACFVVSAMVSRPIGPMSRTVGTVLLVASNSPSTTSKRITLLVWSKLTLFGLLELSRSIFVPTAYLPKSTSTS